MDNAGASDPSLLGDWWDEGYEHDLSLPPDGHREPTTDSGRRYWARVAAVAAQIELALRQWPNRLTPTANWRRLCRILNHFGVGYLVFGSHVARLNGRTRC